MSIKQNGGVFGRNPTFNDVTIEGQLTFDGDIDINSDLKINGALEVDGGDVTISAGNLVIGTSGKGIDFSATAGTGTSELLDDYEEGTWTPGISFGAGTTGIAYSIQVGKYTKVGDMVTASCQVTLSAKGSSTGVVKLTGLPFTASSDANSWTPVSLVLGVITFADFPQGYVRVSSTTVSINEITNAGGETTLTDGNFADNSTVRISATYRV